MGSLISPKDDPQPGNTSQHIDKPGSGTSKPYRDGRILAFNLLALALYTLLSAVSGGGAFIDAFFLVCHVLVCFILALAYKKWVWALSGLAVLLIGVSTCVGWLFNITGL